MAAVDPSLESVYNYYLSLGCAFFSSLTAFASSLAFFCFSSRSFFSCSCSFYFSISFCSSFFFSSSYSTSFNRLLRWSWALLTVFWSSWTCYSADFNTYSNWNFCSPLALVRRSLISFTWFWCVFKAFSAWPRSFWSLLTDWAIVAVSSRPWASPTKSKWNGVFAGYYSVSTRLRSPALDHILATIA